jgi:hypothetical protein
MCTTCSLEEAARLGVEAEALADELVRARLGGAGRGNVGAALDALASSAPASRRSMPSR